MKKVIPEFSRQSGIPQNAGKSEEEEARFWDTHSPLDYPNEFMEVKEPFKFTPELTRNFIPPKAGFRTSL